MKDLDDYPGEADELATMSDDDKIGFLHAYVKFKSEQTPNQLVKDIYTNVKPLINSTLQSSDKNSKRLLIKLLLSALEICLHISGDTDEFIENYGSVQLLLQMKLLHTYRLTF